MPVPSSAGATSSQLRRQRPCAPASSEDHVSRMCCQAGRHVPLLNCRYGALAHQRLGPRSPPPRSPPGWTERLPSFTSSHDSSSSRVLSSDRRGASQLSSPRTSSAAWPTMQGHPLSPMGSRHSYTPPPAARLQSAASPTQPRTPCTPRTPKVLQVWLGDLSDQPWHGRSEKARSRSHASRASCSTRTLSSTLSGTPSSRSSLRFVASRGSREPGPARSPACPLPLSA